MSRQLILETVDDLKKLDPSYLRLVRDHMRNKQTTVQFGLTGIGYAPNYQTCFGNGLKIARHGISTEHKQFDKTEQFDEANLSRPFSYDDIEKAIV